MKGASLIFSIILILSIGLVIGLGLSSLSFYSLINTRQKIKSAQSYYSAEAGIEDSLVRLKKNLQFFSSNTLAVDDSAAQIEISDLIGGARTITSEGDTNGKIRKLSVLYIISSDAVSFYYGAQAGEGGVQMESGSKINGNVFSNGNIIGDGEITDTATIALNNSILSGIDVGGDAYVYSCTGSSNIVGTLYYATIGGDGNCDYSDSVYIGPDEIESRDMPILLEQIDEWKSEAEAEGVIFGDYELAGGQSDSIGPVKITGNMYVRNGSNLTLAGSVYVVGDVEIENNVTIGLDSGYGSLSGILLADGKVNAYNNAILQGSGEEGSYLMILSTNSSLNPFSPAIDLANNVEGAVFYTSNGALRLRNNTKVKEAVGYKMILNNNAEITYESGLENANFTTGPSGGWEVKNWREIE